MREKRNSCSGHKGLKGTFWGGSVVLAFPIIVTIIITTTRKGFVFTLPAGLRFILQLAVLGGS